jgi:hypothetical protein
MAKVVAGGVVVGARGRACLELVQVLSSSRGQLGLDASLESGLGL